MYGILLFVYIAKALEVSCTFSSFFLWGCWGGGGVRSRHKSYCFSGKKRGKFENRYVKAVSDCSSTLLLSFKCNPLRNGHFSEITFDLHLLSDQPRGLVVRVSGYWSWGPGFDSRFCHGNFPLWGRIPMVTMVWVVSRFRLRTPLVFHLHMLRITSSGHRNRASWASQPQKSVTPRHSHRAGHEVLENMWWHWGEKKK
jgi:hypothetical protein